MAKNHNLAFDYSVYDRAEEENKRVIMHKVNPLAAINKRSGVLSVLLAVVVLALLETHLLLAKPRCDAVLIGKIFEIFLIPLARVAA